MEKKQWLHAQAPGRINLIGEHIDYNDGYVLPAAIDKVTTSKLRLNGTASTVNLLAKNVDQSYQFDLNSFGPIEGDWQNYLMGIVSELQKLGAAFQGFDAEFDGNVPIGSGMSSSASLECSLAEGLNALFGLGYNKWQLIKACQMAEHNFVGIKCGIMDQFASVMGQENCAMLLDCKSLDHEYVPLNLGEYELILLNTNVTHALASSEYNKRRSECEEGLEQLKKMHPSTTSFRDVTLEMLSNSKNALSPVIYNRCEHVITETSRVLSAVEALRNENLEAVGQMMYQSHASLTKKYEVSCSELDFLVAESLGHDDILGSRMMGGGFGGCTINIMAKNTKDNLVKRLSESYVRKFNKEISVYPVEIGSGAKVVA